MLTHECKGNASYKHLSIKQENIDLYYKNKPRIFATVPEYDIEQCLFEHRLNKELSVETNIRLPQTIEEFKNTFKKKYSSINYRTDAVGYGFLRTLAHKYYETDFFPDYLGRTFCEDLIKKEAPQQS